jgi:hypothetical protein
LRKVAGEVNPADLFTKHSLSEARLEQLVALHGCKYLGGRAETAPQTRTGVSTKTTMASHTTDGNGRVDAVALGGDDPVSVRDSGPISTSAQSGNDPTMPHLNFDAAALDREYPPLTAPDDGWLDDADEDDDTVLQAGMAIAENIRHEMELNGRRRDGAENDTTRRAGHVGGSHMRNGPVGGSCASGIISTTEQRALHVGGPHKCDNNNQATSTCRRSHPCQHVWAGTSAKGDSDQQQPDGAHLKPSNNNNTTRYSTDYIWNSLGAVAHNGIPCGANTIRRRSACRYTSVSIITTSTSTITTTPTTTATVGGTLSARRRAPPPLGGPCRPVEAGEASGAPRSRLAVKGGTVCKSPVFLYLGSKVLQRNTDCV